ncbi:MAG: glycine/sarcosine/betaine reductase complex component C subunit alpha [Aerococcus sp.]|nr:glycine/sarcosine/betaine reductase complex component C subunit alpha [Aerococcus sp.]
MSDQIKQTISEVFAELATALETGDMGPKIKIGLTINGSEHGFDVMKQAANIAQAKGLFDVVLIGEKVDWTQDFEHYEANTEQAVEATIDRLISDGTIQGCVTLHHNFPIGVSTVGRYIAPATGRDVILATTTGTTSTVRTEGMVLNAINGIIAAKALGIKEPTVGILNVEGAKTVDRALHELSENGYPIHFAESVRADGGAVLRGNDLLTGSADVIITDTLTGNLLMKLMSAFTTGGQYETAGYGYGPAIGEGYEQNICIISRASGAPVIANALQYAYEVAKGGLIETSQREFQVANQAKLKDISEALVEKDSASSHEEAVTAPSKEVVTSSIMGIDVLDLEEAVKALWKADIYAESGMGCSGPIVLVNPAKFERAEQIVKDNGFL